VTSSPFLNTYARYPLTLTQGEGRRVQDAQGRWYLDAICGIAVTALGHNHPEVSAAVHAQVDRLMHVSNLYHVPVQQALATALSELYGGDLFMSNSGSEANETAAKLARKFHWLRDDPRAEILTIENGFHGRTYMSLSMTPREKYKKGFGPMVPGVRSLPLDEIVGAISTATAAVFVEPIQGEGGCRVIDILPALREACDATGTLLVYDEIQCGLGRSGTLLHEPRPDITCLAKALGGGLPLGATLAQPAVAAAFSPGDHGSTFGGNPVACAAGLATLSIILRDNLPARCRELGARLREKLEAAGAEVSGAGLMLAARAGQPAGPLIDAMRERGVLACPAGPDAVRFLPAFTSTEDEIDEMATAYVAALAGA
jgi:acetylornithine/N-succinyldiaminopimelate aminotransferase